MEPVRPAPRFETHQVRRYYDRHTSVFVRLGQGGGAIHRAVWGPGVATREQAFHFVEDRIADLAAGLQSTDGGLHVVDLGCGVGSSLCYLARRLPMRGTGITVSPVQVREAARRIQQEGLADRVVCLEGDYTDLPSGLAPADLAYAIESFVHGPSPVRFFAECARLVRPGGLLVICDDVRRDATGAAARRTVERFCRGWRINALLGRDELRRLARDAGFAHESATDLTPYLELGRPRDRVLAVLSSAFGWVPLVSSRFGPFVGGSALQACLARGWIGYDLLVYRRLG